MIRTKGFSLIELLTVIAIIAILAGITFPIMSRVRDSAYRNSDTASLNALRTALALYKVDQGGYPPAILGYASLYATGPANNVVPADEAIGFMFPRRIDSFKTLQPAMDKADIKAYTTAMWPEQDTRPAQSAPVFDLNGDGIINNAGAPSGCTTDCYYDDDARARQAFGINDPVLRPKPDPLAGAAANRNELIDPTTYDCPGDPSGSNNCIKAQFYNVSGYDVATVSLPGSAKRTELRYALFWTRWGLGAAGTPSVPVLTHGNSHDDPRQLGYDDPPENTVITWDSFFRDYDNGVPVRSKRDIMLFLGGGAKPADSLDVSNRSWRMTP